MQEKPVYKEPNESEWYLIGKLVAHHGNRPACRSRFLKIMIVNQLPESAAYHFVSEMSRSFEPCDSYSKALPYSKMPGAPSHLFTRAN